MLPELTLIEHDNLLQDCEYRVEEVQVANTYKGHT